MLCDLRRGDVVRPGTDQKKPRLRITQPGPCLGTSKTVSRVLYLTVIYLDAPLPVRSSHLPEAAGPAMCFHHGVAPDRVYIDGQSPAVGCALTAPFHPYLVDAGSRSRVPPLAAGRAPFTASPLPRKTCVFPGAPIWGMRRYLSVALFLKSPSAGVTRYPCPVEPGLSSWTAFQPAHATVCFTHAYLLYRKAGEMSTAENWPVAL